MLILTTEQIRREEEKGFADGISYEKMMRTAGNGVADAVMKQYPDAADMVVVCGKGKNGGDGFVAAMRFAQMGKQVKILLAMGEPKDSLALKMYREAVLSGIEVIDYTKDNQNGLVALQNADCLVDAVFGIGFSGELREPLSELAKQYNGVGGKKVALDIPSGLTADSTRLPELYFHADITLTMHAAKPVHCFFPAKEACGNTGIVPIGFPVSVNPNEAITETHFDEIAHKFIPRTPNTHKGSYGYALSVCGSYSMPGAAALAAEAAVESGVGLLAAAFPDRAYAALSSKLTEQIYVPCPSDTDGAFAVDSVRTLLPHIKKATAVLFGCGVGTGLGCRRVLEYIMQTADCPLILDADGINIISSNIDVLREPKVPVLLTPHPGEMARLTGKTVREINENRVQTARDFAVQHGVCLLLKGHQTAIASPDGTVVVNATGNPGMATGGSGDMLAGLILSFAAQGMKLFDAAVCGAYIHGMSGDLAAEKYSKMGTTPLRMLEMLPSVLSQIEKAM